MIFRVFCVSASLVTGVAFLPAAFHTNRSRLFYVPSAKSEVGRNLRWEMITDHRVSAHQNDVFTIRESTSPTSGNTFTCQALQGKPIAK